MTSDVTPAEEQANRRLVELGPRVQALRQRMTAPPREPKPLSALWSDDRASAPYQVSHAAWSAIQHAGDDLVAGYSMTVTQASETHFEILTRPYALYPVLRAAYENACRSLWLTSGPSREERVRRRFRMALKDARMFDEVGLKLRNPEGGRYQKRLEDLKPLARTAGVSINSLRQNLSDVEVVRGAMAPMTIAPDTSEVIWRLLSGLTHGDSWAMLNLLDREEVGTSKDGTSLTLKTTSPSNKVGMLFEICLHTTERAVTLYDNGCTARFQP